MKPIPAALLALFLVASPAFAAPCGKERRSIKTGTDAHVRAIDVKAALPMTIAAMRRWPAPNPIPPADRVAPYETTIYEVTGTLVGFKSESDSDYHLVLADAKGETIIAEIPSPNCVTTGPLAASIARARAAFDAQFTATDRYHRVRVPVCVRGVGMFDFKHGQTGVAPNGIEIHPVLEITFLNDKGESK